MSDLLEAILGAIYLDADFHTEPIRNIFQKLFLSRLNPDVDYSSERPVMETLMRKVQASGCRQAVLKKNEVVEYRSLNHRIVHKNIQPLRVINLQLVLHETVIVAVEASSYGLAKLKLAEKALALLGTGQSNMLHEVCSCVGSDRRSVEIDHDEDEFSF